MTPLESSGLPLTHVLKTILYSKDVVLSRVNVIMKLTLKE
jgi:hypothetical protein